MLYRVQLLNHYVTLNHYTLKKTLAGKVCQPINISEDIFLSYTVESQLLESQGE